MHTDGNRISFTEAPRPGRSIRLRGLDFRKGRVLAKAGRRLGAHDLALLAAGDNARVAVRRRPLVAFAATGDELPARASRAGLAASRRRPATDYRP